MDPKRKLIQLAVIILLLIVIPLPILLSTHESGQEPPSTTATAPPTTTLPEPVSLETAAANLANADSLRLTISMINQADTYRYENTYSFQKLTSADGTDSVRYTQSSTMEQNGQLVESIGDQAYYIGNMAYVHYAHAGSTAPATKWISDKPFQMGSIVEDQSGIYLSSGKNSMLETFSSLSPTRILWANGTISYYMRNMTKEQFSAVYAAFAGDSVVDEMFGSISADCTFSIWAEVDDRGYLTLFKMEIMNLPSATGSQNITIQFVIDQIDTISVIDTPDYVKNFSYVEGAEVMCIHGGITAHYRYSAAPGSGGSFAFVGFGDTYTDSYTVESYEVFSEIDGIPVTEVQGVLNNTFCSVRTERLIIPAGMRINIQGLYTGNTFDSFTEDTTLFFRDAAQLVDKTFLVVGESAGANEAVFFKGAYFADQWDLVDGIPTPKT